MKFVKWNAFAWTFNSGLFLGGAFHAALCGKTNIIVPQLYMGIVATGLGLFNFLMLQPKPQPKIE